MNQPSPQGLPLDVYLCCYLLRMCYSSIAGKVALSLLAGILPMLPIQIYKCLPLSPQDTLQSSLNTPLSLGLTLPSYSKKSTFFFWFHFDLIPRKDQGSLPVLKGTACPQVAAVLLILTQHPEELPWMQREAGFRVPVSAPPVLFLSLMSCAWPLGPQFEMLTFRSEMIKKSFGQITLNN